MLERVVIDLCAALLAEEVRLSLMVSQAEKDGLMVHCFAALPREQVRRALRVKGIMEHFDSLLHEDILHIMLPEELAVLADTSRTFWVRTPEEMDYRLVLKRLSPRQRSLPRALHLLGKPLDSEGIFEPDAGSPSLEDA